MNYTCHAVVLVCHVGPVTWQMFLSFHVIPIPFPPFQNIKKLSSRKSLGPALKKISLCCLNHHTKIQQLCHPDVCDCTGIKRLCSHSDPPLFFVNRVAKMLFVFLSRRSHVFHTFDTHTNSRVINNFEKGKSLGNSISIM